MLIGLSGKRGAGKDTVAAALVSDYGFTRVAFADQLKVMLYVQNPLVMLDPSPYTSERTIDRLADLVDAVGWDGAKAHADVRQLLQRAGQWMFTVDKLFWVKAAFEAARDRHGSDVVITDVRFSHEAEWLRSAGGLLIRVERSHHVVADADASETDADSWDYDGRLWNDGPGLSDPRAMAAGLMEWIGS